MAVGNRRGVCAHCGVSIVDPTVQVVHGDLTFCCVNCSTAMEATGSGSDPKALKHGDDVFHCAHCGVPIVHEDTMETRGENAYCCSNCAAMTEQHAGVGG